MEMIEKLSATGECVERNVKIVNNIYKWLVKRTGRKFAGLNSNIIEEEQTYEDN